MMAVLRVFVPLLALICGALASPSIDAAFYKDFNVSRGINYQYYFSSPQDMTKPYLLFLHGFPSSSYDWRYQIEFFSAQGYGLVVPDMLGYGGTGKPEDVEAYKSSLITKDLVEILDHEDAERVVAIGHDWGSKPTSRLANYFPDRFLGFAFYAVGYIVPPGFVYEEFEASSEAAVGYNPWGYWSFLSQDDAAQIIKDHIDSFFSLGYATDPRLTITHWSPTGVLQAWLESNSTTDSWLSQEEYNTAKSAFLASGIASSLNWYKIVTSDVDMKDGQDIPAANVNITKPVFFGGALRDYNCIATTSRASLFEHAPGFTFQDYDAGHWVMIQQADAVNKDLLAWIESSVL